MELIKKIPTIFFICAFTLAVYSSNLQNQLFWDDEAFITKNSFVTNFSLQNLKNIFTKNLDAGFGLTTDYYRPIPALTYALNYLIHKSNPIGYHLINNSLHIINGLLVYAIIQKIFNSKSLANLTAFIFLLHPVHTQSVTYISARDNLLSCAFLLSTLYLHIRSKWAPGPASLFAFTLAILSRETSISFPLFITGLHFIFQKPNAIKGTYIYFLISGFYTLLRLTVLNFKQTTNLSLFQEYSNDILFRTTTFIGNLVEYFRLIFFPSHLRFRMDFPVHTISSITFLVGLVILCIFSVTYLLAKDKKTKTVWLTGWSLFLVNLFLNSGIPIPLHFTIQEHWLYLPIIGIILIVSWCMQKLLQNPFGKILVALMLLTYSAYSVSVITERNILWGNPIAVWENVASYPINNSSLLNNLGVHYSNSGQFEKAISYYKRSVTNDPKFTKSHFNLGQAYKVTNQTELAISSYKEAIAQDPNYIDALANLSGLLGETDKWSEATTYLSMLTDIDPKNPLNYYNLGFAYAKSNQFDKSLKNLYKALELSTDENTISKITSLIEAVKKAQVAL